MANTKPTAIEDALHEYFPFGFPISDKVWSWLELEELLSGDNLKEAAESLYILRKVSDRYNRKRSGRTIPHEVTHAGQMISMATIIDTLRYVMLLYCAEEQPGAMKRGREWASQRKNKLVVEKPTTAFAALFPPEDVRKKKIEIETYLERPKKPLAPPETVSGENILLYLAMTNRAFRPFHEMFDDKDLKQTAPYEQLVETLERYFAAQPWRVAV
jgi:hypothetical protein